MPETDELTALTVRVIEVSGYPRVAYRYEGGVWTVDLGGGSYPRMTSARGPTAAEAARDFLEKLGRLGKASESGLWRR